MTKWFNINCVIMASNYRGVGIPNVCTPRWKKATKEYILVERPEVAREYVLQ